MRYLLPFILCAMFLPASAAFIAPEEGPVPFRRDKLPVSVDTMTTLSDQLVTLAGSIKQEYPKKQRTSAQMLALAVALDPSNRRAVRSISQLEKGEALPAPKREQIGLAKARCWNLLEWLVQPEAGEHGQALGRCLGDVLMEYDPSHPKAAKRIEKGEQGAWNQWVAGVRAFRKGVVKRPQQAGPAKVEEPKPEPKLAKILQNEVVMKVPVLLPRKKSEAGREYQLVPMKLRAWKTDKPQTFVVRMAGPKWSAVRKGTADDLAKYLTKTYGQLPKGLTLAGTFPDNMQASLPAEGNTRILEGALWATADRVFSGGSSGAAVIAEIGDGGELQSPPHLWRILRDLAKRDGQGQRVILPSASRDLLPSLLTLDKPDFFMNYEVLLANSLTEMSELSSSEPDEVLAKANEDFETIRMALGTRSIGGFVTHRSTQQRLVQIVEEMPAHASARMLALRGTASWPKDLDRKTLAREVRMALEPIGPVLAMPTGPLMSKKFLDTDHAIREVLEELEDLASSSADRKELVEAAEKMSRELKDAAGDIRKMRSNNNEYLIPQRVAKTRLAYRDLMNKLINVVGDREEYRMPNMGR